MASGSFTIKGTVTGLLTGAKDLGTVTIANASAVANTSVVTLALGDTTVPIPTAAVAALFVPATGSTAVLKLKGAAGDTGVRLASTGAQVLNFGTPHDASFIVNASAATSAEVLFL